MTYALDAAAQRRLDAFLDRIGNVLANDKRRASFAIYAHGLLPPSVELECLAITRIAPAHLREVPDAVVLAGSAQGSPVTCAAGTCQPFDLSAGDPTLNWGSCR